MSMPAIRIYHEIDIKLHWERINIWSHHVGMAIGMICLRLLDNRFNEFGRQAV